MAATELRAQGDLAGATRAMQSSLTLQPAGALHLDLNGLDWEAPEFWAPIGKPYQELLALHSTPGLEFDAGVIAEQAGMPEEAIAHFQRAAAAGYYVRDADSGDPEHRVGRLLL